MSFALPKGVRGVASVDVDAIAALAALNEGRDLRPLGVAPTLCLASPSPPGPPAHRGHERLPGDPAHVPGRELRRPCEPLTATACTHPSDEEMAGRVRSLPS